GQAEVCTPYICAKLLAVAGELRNLGRSMRETVLGTGSFVPNCVTCAARLAARESVDAELYGHTRHPRRTQIFSFSPNKTDTAATRIRAHYRDPRHKTKLGCIQQWICIQRES